MMIAETTATVILLLLALYGCTCAIKNLTLFMVTPRKKYVQLELVVDAAVEGVEQQLRYALVVSKQIDLPFYITDNGMTAEQREICDRLLLCPKNNDLKT